MNVELSTAQFMEEIKMNAQKISNVSGIAVETINAEIETMVSTLRIPKKEATKLVAEKYDVDEFTSIDTINSMENGSWTSVNGKVTFQKETGNGTIVGYIADETDSISFVAFNMDATDMTIEKGQVYDLENVVVDEYNDNKQIKITSKSRIKVSDKEVKLSVPTKKGTGFFSRIYDSTGIKRKCPECGKKVTDTDKCQNQNCTQHQKTVDPNLTVSITARFDDGNSSNVIVFANDIAEEILGKSAEELQQIAESEMDFGIVVTLAEEKLCGKYHTVEYKNGDTNFGESIERCTNVEDVIVSDNKGNDPYVRITPKVYTSLDDDAIIKKEQNGKTVKVAHLPDNKESRLFAIAGALMEVDSLSTNMLKGKIVTQFGNVYITANNYSPEALSVLEEVKESGEPKLVMATSYMDVRSKGDRTFRNLRANNMFEIEGSDVDIWMSEAINKLE
jgi:hypothetical protein